MAAAKLVLKLRPLTACEDSRRESILRVDTSASGRSTLMISDGVRLFQIASEEIAHSNEELGGVWDKNRDKRKMFAVIGGKQAGKRYSVFGPGVKEGTQREVREIGLAEIALIDAFRGSTEEVVGFAAGIVTGRQRLLDFQEGGGEKSIRSVTAGLETLCEIRKKRDKAIADEGEIATFLQFTPTKAAQTAICILDSTQSLLSDCIQSLLSPAKSSFLPLHFPESFQLPYELFLVAVISPIVDFASETIEMLQRVATFQGEKKPESQKVCKKRAEKRCVSLCGRSTAEAEIANRVITGREDIACIIESLRQCRLSSFASQLPDRLPGRCVLCTLVPPCTHSPPQSSCHSPASLRSKSTIAHRYQAKTQLTEVDFEELVARGDREIAIRTKLHTFREEKLQRQLQRMEEAQLRQQEEKQAEVLKEVKRRRYAERLKEKIANYHQLRPKALQTPMKPAAKVTVRPSPRSTSLYAHKRNIVFSLVSRQEKQLSRRKAHANQSVS